MTTFDDLKSDGLARVRIEPDYEPYMFGDAEDEAEVRDIIERDGVWGYIAEINVRGRWVHVDSCWGFAGEVYLDALTEARAACVKAFLAREHDAFEAVADLF